MIYSTRSVLVVKGTERKPLQEGGAGEEEAYFKYCVCHILYFLY